MKAKIIDIDISMKNAITEAIKNGNTKPFEKLIKQHNKVKFENEEMLWYTIHNICINTKSLPTELHDVSLKWLEEHKNEIEGIQLHNI